VKFKTEISIKLADGLCSHSHHHLLWFLNGEAKVRPKKNSFWISFFFVCRREDLHAQCIQYAKCKIKKETDFRENRSLQQYSSSAILLNCTFAIVCAVCDSLNHSGYSWSCWPPRKKRRRRTCNKLADLRVSRDIIRSNSPGYRLCFTLRNRRDYFVLFLSCFFCCSLCRFFFVFYFIFYILRRSGESRGCASFLFLAPIFVIFYLWTNEANYTV
jgi:hypothetical protein